MEEIQQNKCKVAEMVEHLLQNYDEEYLEDLWLQVMEEMESDEECADKKMYRILTAWRKQPKLVDDLLITICGWNLESLMNLYKSNTK